MGGIEAAEGRGWEVSLGGGGGRPFPRGLPLSGLPREISPGIRDSARTAC